MADKLNIEIRLTPEEFGALLGCVGGATTKVDDPAQRQALLDLGDALRDTQRSVLSPMSVKDGMGLVREIQDSENAMMSMLRA